MGDPSSIVTPQKRRPRRGDCSVLSKHTASCFVWSSAPAWAEQSRESAERCASRVRRVRTEPRRLRMSSFPPEVHASSQGF